MRKDIWICIEKGEYNCSAYAPAVPGCITTGKTVEETKRNMEEALAFHLDGMLEDGLSLDDIAADFPADFPAALARTPGDKDEEYFALVHIDVAPVAPAEA